MAGEVLDAPEEEARQAALEVLHHNARGPYLGLPRTAGWGYPEPYTRDLMITALGVLATGDAELTAAIRRMLVALSESQSRLGAIPSLAHDPLDLGASDATPWFLIGVALLRRAGGEQNFLADAAARALTWMDYQSPEDVVMVAQQPTSDWRDEQWVLGYGLYVNTLVYTYLRLLGHHERAAALAEMMNHVDVRGENEHKHAHEGFVIRDRPYYALWAWKVHNNERFDLLGNSLAILAGIASPERSRQIIGWVEERCAELQMAGELAVDLPPCLLPYVRRGDPDWYPRFERFNRPGHYHNGGIWPFICGFYVAALVAAGEQRLAEQKLAALAELVRPARRADVAFGFNEWVRGQDGTPQGQDWQTWSAGMYLYAHAAVQQGRTPFFDEVRAARGRFTASP